MKIKSFPFLKYILDSIPTDIIFLISKYCGRFIHEIDYKFYNIINTKKRGDKYYTRHLIKRRGYSI